MSPDNLPLMVPRPLPQALRLLNGTLMGILRERYPDAFPGGVLIRHPDRGTYGCPRVVLSDTRELQIMTVEHLQSAFAHRWTITLTGFGGAAAVAYVRMRLGTIPDHLPGSGLLARPSEIMCARPLSVLGAELGEIAEPLAAALHIPISYG